mmetsp:Transcript_37511/g.43787  ORF Transcript_37511/g.43787 Transcript_37511/m.43787 type:complete len:398 (-) Transcript_37511:30-1223(-)
MLNGREKVGAGAAAHRVMIAECLTAKKSKRLTLPFGPAEESAEHRESRDTVHEHYIREIPLAGGGLGCALWDGGLVLARWIYARGSTVFARRSVIELGCGVGLAGIMAAHWAESVVLTDYIDETVRNALYNVGLNSSSDADDDEMDCGSSSTSRYERNIKSRVTARLLDWDAFAEEKDTKKKEGEGKEEDCPHCCVNAADHLGNLTPAKTQPWHRCRTCWPSDMSSGVCSVCAVRCHKGHDVDMDPQPAEKFQCDCSKTHTRSVNPTSGAKEPEGCTARPPQPPLNPVDIIIGSELTYNLLSCESLANVVDALLKPSGVFYEVLSDDRDGVSVFIAAMESRGFCTVKHPAPSYLTGNFGTRKWSKQNEESYSLYTWRRRGGDDDGSHKVDTTLPDMI